MSDSYYSNTSAPPRNVRFQVKIVDRVKPTNFYFPLPPDPGATVSVLQFYGPDMQEQYHTLDYTYPSSFLSSSADGFRGRLSFLSYDPLLSCVRRFQSIPTKHRKKADLRNVVQSDFARQTNRLIQFSAPELIQRVSLAPAGHSTLCFLLACQFIHDRYVTAVTSQLLCSQTHWNPPEVADNSIIRAWVETPLTRSLNSDHISGKLM